MMLSNEVVARARQLVGQNVLDNLLAVICGHYTFIEFPNWHTGFVQCCYFLTEFPVCFSAQFTNICGTPVDLKLTTSIPFWIAPTLYFGGHLVSGEISLPKKMM